MTVMGPLTYPLYCACLRIPSACNYLFYGAWRWLPVIWYMSVTTCGMVHDGDYLWYGTWRWLPGVWCMTVTTCGMLHDGDYMWYVAWRWLHVVLCMTVTKCGMVHDGDYLCYGAWRGLPVVWCMTVTTCGMVHDGDYLWYGAWQWRGWGVRSAPAEWWCTLNTRQFQSEVMLLWETLHHWVRFNLRFSYLSYIKQYIKYSS